MRMKTNGKTKTTMMTVGNDSLVIRRFEVTREPALPLRGEGDVGIPGTL
jgi:hypothetical protein